MNEHLPHASEFVDLSSGRCHYRVDGPAGGRTLLLLHGATVPAWQFDCLAPLLNEAGFRTIRFDLYGHGYSARPDTRHDFPLFLRQTGELLDALQAGEDIHLLGHSLGAAIAARLALQSPRRFASLVLTAPMLDFAALNPATRLLQVPVLGEALMPCYVLPMLRRRRRRRYRQIEDGRFVQRFNDQFRVPGFGRSLLSLVRSNVLADQRDCYRALNTLDLPVLMLSGEHDRIATPAHMQALAAELPAMQWRVIAGAEHAFAFTHAPELVARMLDFFPQPEATIRRA